ncbi:MAG: right-handed parallel beta-helix repeat-containing protein [Phycisphaerales bacterium]|nr:right-handed parallel beta-helix repeat-containing protein [Phycisphaerales bacterium]
MRNVGDRLIVASGVLLLAVAAEGATLFVSANLTTGANDGSSWANAFQGTLGLQDALATAMPGDSVWVSAGVYHTGVSGDQVAGFHLPNDVGVYGGFAGTEAMLSERDVQANITTLSGDLDDDDTPAGFVGLNAHHVVVSDGGGAGTLLDGFHVEGGVSQCCGFISSQGGGVQLISGELTVRNCTFARNHASRFGGDIAAMGSAITIESCLFTGTSQGDFGGHAVLVDDPCAGIVRDCQFVGAPPTTGGNAGIGIYANTTAPAGLLVEDCYFSIETVQFTCPAGVGMHVRPGTFATVRRCTFDTNLTCGGGGGIHCDGTGVIDRCLFIANEGQADGGAALFSFDGLMTVTNCVFAGNDRHGFSTVHLGGETHFYNCTFFNNGSADPKVFGVHRVITYQDAPSTFDNCVFWDNESTQPGQLAVIAHSSFFAEPTFDNCLVQDWDGTFAGVNNFSADPRFADPLGPDLVKGTRDDNLSLAPGSPCIDRGDSTVLPIGVAEDFAGNARFVDVITHADMGVPNGMGATVDLGALEAPADFPAACPGDANGSTTVDLVDLNLVLFNFGSMVAPGASGDVDYSGTVDLVDLNLVLFNFGSACS